MTVRKKNAVKVRQNKRTLLLFGEGTDEAHFLKFLRRSYSRQDGYTVKIATGQGKVPVNIVKSCIREEGDFSKRVVFMDKDKPENEIQDALRMAAKHDVEIIFNEPCLESTFLKALNVHCPEVSAECKKAFRKKYSSDGKTLTPGDYEKIFSSDLKTRSGNIECLERVISLIEGSF